MVANPSGDLAHEAIRSSLGGSFCAGVQAEARGHLLAIYVMSESAIHSQESVETRLRWLRRQVKTLLS